jgi:hypothetical protein
MLWVGRLSRPSRQILHHRGEGERLLLDTVLMAFPTLSSLPSTVSSTCLVSTFLLRRVLPDLETGVAVEWGGFGGQFNASQSESED